jgi:hypothetical protein
MKFAIPNASSGPKRGTLKRMVIHCPGFGWPLSALQVNARPPLETSTICPCESTPLKSSANQTGQLKCNLRTPLRSLLLSIIGIPAKFSLPDSKSMNFGGNFRLIIDKLPAIQLIWPAGVFFACNKGLALQMFFGIPDFPAGMFL